MKLRTGSKPDFVVKGSLPKVIKLTMGNLILPRVAPSKSGFFT